MERMVRGRPGGPSPKAAWLGRWAGCQEADQACRGGGATEPRVEAEVCQDHPAGEVLLRDQCADPLSGPASGNAEGVFAPGHLGELTRHLPASSSTPSWRKPWTGAAPTRRLPGHPRPPGLPPGDGGTPARALVRHCRQLTERIDALPAEISTLVARPASALPGIRGCGPLTAAKTLGESADIRRFRSRDAYARHNGTAPLPVWSSNRARHRLSRTGNRQPDAAPHRIALTRAAATPTPEPSSPADEPAATVDSKPSACSNDTSPTSHLDVGVHRTASALPRYEAALAGSDKTVAVLHELGDARAPGSPRRSVPGSRRHCDEGLGTHSGCGATHHHGLRTDNVLEPGAVAPDGTRTTCSPGFTGFHLTGDGFTSMAQCGPIRRRPNGRRAAGVTGNPSHGRTVRAAATSAVRQARALVLITLACAPAPTDQYGRTATSHRSRTGSAARHPIQRPSRAVAANSTPEASHVHRTLVHTRRNRPRQRSRSQQRSRPGSRHRSRHDARNPPVPQTVHRGLRQRARQRTRHRHRPGVHRFREALLLAERGRPLPGPGRWAQGVRRARRAGAHAAARHHERLLGAGTAGGGRRLDRRRRAATAGRSVVDGRAGRFDHGLLPARRRRVRQGARGEGRVGRPGRDLPARRRPAVAVAVRGGPARQPRPVRARRGRQVEALRVRLRRQAQEQAIRGRAVRRPVAGGRLLRRGRPRARRGGGRQEALDGQDALARGGRGRLGWLRGLRVEHRVPVHHPEDATAVPVRGRPVGRPRDHRVRRHHHHGRGGAAESLRGQQRPVAAQADGVGRRRPGVDRRRGRRAGRRAPRQVEPHPVPRPAAPGGVGVLRPGAE
ncbi:hypothetical protein CKY47_28965 [Saccharothrix yanglingensis]|uniref:Transposase IS116/IS110/IS902 C-terminal domain-containing protein n=1 Tax=Saccharothrix yanglingensis TaxID=659496 RepID=A0ABU0X8L7_9PSEU|nr:hypothetical protein [Saccharothrix yanglingensis]